MQNISAARQALGQKDIQHAMSLVQQTIAMTQQAEAAPTATSPAAGPAGGSPQTQRFGPPGYHAGEKMH